MKTISIALSEGCNLNCIYCNVDKQSKISIDPLIFLETFKEFRKNNLNEQIQIDFYGGEPLLHFNKIKFLLETINDKNVKYYMPTNGILLDKEKIEILNKYNVKVSLSFDGLWQDINRKTGKIGSIRTYIEKRDIFKSLNNISIHCMINPGNYDLLNNHLFLYDFLKNPNMEIIRDIGVWDYDSVLNLKKGIDELFQWYIDDTSKEIPNIILFYLRHIILFKSKKIELKSCGAGNKFFSFSENNLIACNRFKDDLELQEKIPEYLEMSECEKCDVKSYCRKGCLYENIKNDGPVVEVCEIFKHFYYKIFEMLNILKDDKNFKSVIEREIKNELGY